MKTKINKNDFIGLEIKEAKQKLGKEWRETYHGPSLEGDDYCFVHFMHTREQTGFCEFVTKHNPDDTYTVVEVNGGIYLRHENKRNIISEYNYCDSKIIEYSDRTFLATKLVDGDIVTKECSSLLQAKNFIFPKKPLKLYEMNLKFVEHYSGRVLVEARSATEARERLREHWDNADYIYEKITDCPDDQALTVSKPKNVTEEDASHFSYHAFIREDD